MRHLAIIALVFAAGAFAAYVTMQMGQEKPALSAAEVEFHSWKLKHGKTYSGAEHSTRLSNYLAAKKRIDEINSVPRNFKVGINKFADLTSEEFSGLYLGLRKREVMTQSTMGDSVQDLPASIDWRKLGAVTPVKDQGQCGSCWAFSVTGALEGANFNQSGKLLSFAEQQLVDCSGSAGNQGCNGGDMFPTMAEYTAQQGIQLEDDYDYTAEDGECLYDSTKVAYKNKGAIRANSNKDLLAAVANGPVSVSVEADTSYFQYYESGVLDSDECGTDLDHGVLAVGYGTDKSKVDYWIVKNSWGDSWGDNGYLKIARTEGDGICGINMDNSQPTN